MTELITTSPLPGKISLHYCVLFNDSSSFNDTDLDADQDQCFIPIVVISSISLFICLVGLVGNGMVLWFLGFRIKKDPFTIYILNLAIADFGFLLCMVAFLIIIILYLHMDFLGGFVIIKAIQWVALFIYNTGLYLLTAISVQRCLSVLYPIWYRCHRPKNLSSIVCALLWALSILVTGLECYFCINDYDCSKMTIFSCVLSFLIFTPLMVLSSLTLFIKVRCSSQRHQSTKLYIVIMVTILFFLMFALPLRVIVLMAFLSHTMIHLFVMSLVILLPCMNSSINPFIYFLVGRHGKRQLREPLKEVFQRIFNGEAGPQEKRPTKQVK
ncbi:mas-related G-protein coupled receptor member H-like [Trachemys scripta elegans]|uniref:mas-related G-protein coupled receptor member H-like n=1 Tax=Trachemys scripta elegans TaxID=31138 RepID=UPI0015545746|nr:mas-related G-protein coupled receptor member H-like [Trachemys scripta elegans]